MSPFLQIRWKRLILDEGHIVSADTTNRNRFLGWLSVERRWIVSGTPTTNLRGVNFGSGEGVEVSKRSDGMQDTGMF